MLNRHLSFLLACTLSGVALWPAIGQQPSTPSPDRANVTLARRLLEAMHVGDNMVGALNGAVADERQRDTLTSPMFYDTIVARMKRSVPEVLDSMAPSYARRFSASELEAMIGFYESPPGKNLASSQAALNVETTLFAHRWGARLAATAIKDFKAAGMKITKP